MSTSSRGRVLRLIAVNCAVMLSGCGNFSEHVTEGEWKEVGAPVSPISQAHGDFNVTSISAGQGHTIRAGDLVYARFRTGTASYPDDFNAWIWTGSEPEEDSVYPGEVELGPAGLRASLIGMRVGSRFTVRAQTLPCCDAFQVPLFALAPRDAAHRLSHYEKYQWPVAGLSKVPNQLARIEILDSCPAHLFERRATLWQWGYVFNIGDMHYSASRHGTLVWGALQADCAAPRRPMRFEIGPFYDGSDYTTDSNLLGWDSSYSRASQKHFGAIIGLVVFVVAFVTARWFVKKRSATAASKR